MTKIKIKIFKAVYTPGYSVSSPFITLARVSIDTGLCTKHSTFSLGNISRNSSKNNSNAVTGIFMIYLLQVSCTIQSHSSLASLYQAVTSRTSMP